MHGLDLALATQNSVCVQTLGSVFMVLYGFSTLLFVPIAPKALTEIKRTLLLYTAFCPLILELDLSNIIPRHVKYGLL